jgi:cystathionine gamma-synthase
MPQPGRQDTVLHVSQYGRHYRTHLVANSKMSTRDLLTQPAWEGADLGAPLPESAHAVSVALPRWQDVIGYEEKKPEVVAKMKLGYPRFVIHPQVQELAKQIGQGHTCLPFPSLNVAKVGAAYVRHAAKTTANVVLGKGVFGVVTDAAGAQALKDFWQHAGLIVSSRRAEAALQGRRENADEAATARKELIDRLAGLYDCAPDDVLLTPTGMAAQFAAFRILSERSPNQRTAQLGFPYVDTLKIQQKFGAGAHLITQLDDCEPQLAKVLSAEPLAAVFAEFPGNPLLGCADLRQLTPLLRQYGVPLVADDVVGTPFNLDLSPHADLITTSLTKYIVGTCDAMGGALICNPRSPYYTELKAAARDQHEELLWGEDATILATQARTFEERMKRHNANGLFIAEKIRSHPAIARVWYPKWENAEAYEAIRRPEGGYGALLSFLSKNDAITAPRIFDAMRISKGPSLGTIFSLASPFTLLAHYTELDWAESCGVPRNLIRLSVGLEDPNELWQRLEHALTAGA